MNAWFWTNILSMLTLMYFLLAWNSKRVFFTATPTCFVCEQGGSQGNCLLVSITALYCLWNIQSTLSHDNCELVLSCYLMLLCKSKHLNKSVVVWCLLTGNRNCKIITFVERSELEGNPTYICCWRKWAIVEHVHLSAVGGLIYRTHQSPTWTLACSHPWQSVRRNEPLLWFRMKNKTKTLWIKLSSRKAYVITTKRHSSQIQIQIVATA